MSEYFGHEFNDKDEELIPDAMARAIEARHWRETVQSYTDEQLVEVINKGLDSEVVERFERGEITHEELKATFSPEVLACTHEQGWRRMEEKLESESPAD